jgi:hypothetical protein
MNRWRVGEDRGSKETDGCPLTNALPLLMHMYQCATKTDTSPRHTTHPAATFLMPAPSVSPPNDYYRTPISVRGSPRP